MTTPNLETTLIPDSVTLILKEPVSSVIEFRDGDGWLMRISEGRISFNHAERPDLAVDDFAKAVIHIFENSNLHLQHRWP